MGKNLPAKDSSSRSEDSRYNHRKPQIYNESNNIGDASTFNKANFLGYLLSGFIGKSFSSQDHSKRAG